VDTMSEQMKWEGGPVLDLRHIIQERMDKEEKLMEILDRYPKGVPKFWEDDEIVEMLKRMECEGGIIFSSWVV
jgi:hypothetical protein